MKRIYTIAMLLMGLLTIVGVAMSCGIDDISSHEDPEHPLFVSYAITAGVVSTSEETSPQLMRNILKWIQENQKVYDRQVNYKTGEASEFATTDAEAIRNYEEFVPKFKAYLNKISEDLANGTYGKEITVNARFQVYAKRSQGENGTLMYEEFDYVYPTPNSSQ